MKTGVIVCILLAGAWEPALAQWAVIDVASIQQNAMNYVALVEQLSRQATQITNQVRQIEQFEAQMKRVGDMANVKNLVGFSELSTDLRLPTKIKSWTDRLAQVDGRGLFGDSRSGIFREIGSEFKNFGGESIERDPIRYKEAHDLVTTVDQFKTIQNDVYTRRQNLKEAIDQTSEAMRVSDTEAEQKKLGAVLNAQYGQLAAVDAEVALSAAEVQVKTAEATAMTNAQHEADAEARSRLSQEESQIITTAFRPQYECLLQYVTEKKFAP